MRSSARSTEHRRAHKAAVAAFEEAFKYAPAGSESMVGNLKTAFATAQSAYDNFTAINKQIATSVERNVAWPRPSPQAQ